MKYTGKILLLIPLFFFSSNTLAIEQTGDLIPVTKPAVVQVSNSVQGTIQIPNFIFNYDTDEISTTTKVSGYDTVMVHDTRIGTGFIISEDGLIVTSSDILNGAIDEAYKNAAQKYLQSSNEDSQDAAYKKAYQIIYEYLKNNSVKKIEVDMKVLTHKADTIYMEPSIDPGQKNIALIKIDAKKLPSLSVSVASIALGQNVYSLGYPVAASNPVFAAGVINFAQKGQYQTDIKAFNGSNGSPLLDMDGKVVGVLDGDFVISSSNIVEALSLSGMVANPGSYPDRYIAGLRLLRDNRCLAAIQEFDKAKDIHPDFSVDNYVQPKIDECNSLIASGQSRDTLFARLIFMFTHNISNTNLWAGIAGLFILLIIMYMYFSHRLRRDEKEMGIGMDQKTEGEIVADTKKKNNKETQGLRHISTGEFAIATPFESIEREPVLPTTSKIKIMPIEKVPVPQHVEPAPSIVTPPNAIQPDGPLVFVVPFKTLNSPITTMQKDLVELQKNIKTDLPPVKKDEDIP